MLPHELFSLASMLIAAYFIGGIPTGYLIAKYWGIDDIRKHGSGTIGATNVARVLGMPFFFLVTFLDMCKASSFLVCAQYFCASSWCVALSGIALLVGNCYSPFLQLRGGKGVATASGSMLILQPMVFIASVCIWLVVFLATKTVGIASVIAAVSALVWILIWYPNSGALLFYGLVSIVLIIIRHRTNIIRYTGHE